MHLRIKFVLVNLFLWCYCTILQAQSFDSWLIKRIEREINLFFEDHSIAANWKINTNYPDLTFAIERLLTQRNLNLVLEADSGVHVFVVETKGSFSKSKKRVEASGVILFKVFVNNNLVQSKRIDIQPEEFLLSDFPESRSLIWEIVEKKERANLTTWLEPTLILSTMAVTVYLLFSVRS